MQAMNELAFYTLAGQPKSPRELIDEVRSAEALGLGSAFISERFNVKEAVTLSGAVGAMSGPLHGGAPANFMPSAVYVRMYGSIDGLTLNSSSRSQS